MNTGNFKAVKLTAHTETQSPTRRSTCYRQDKQIAVSSSTDSQSNQFPGQTAVNCWEQVKGEGQLLKSDVCIHGY